MSYCARADLNKRFGTVNVTKWGDINDDANTTTITDSVNVAISIADSEVDSYLRGTQWGADLVTEAGTTPYLIKHVAVEIAGCALYENRGVADFDPQKGPVHRLIANRENARGILREIQAGARRPM